jgi:hypothetical protein
MSSLCYAVPMWILLVFLFALNHQHTEAVVNQAVFHVTLLAPTARPSANPTPIPSAEPSSVPTFPPTAKPSAEPSSEPTILPTAYPTARPSVNPTTIPTAEPSSVPTTAPSVLSTTRPTAAPTFLRIPAPTRAPESTRTSSPTASFVTFNVRVRCSLDIVSESLSAEDADSTNARTAVIEAIWNASQIIPVENLYFVNFGVVEYGADELVHRHDNSRGIQLRAGRPVAVSTMILMVSWEGSYTNQDVSFINATESIVYVKQRFFAAVDDSSFVRVLVSKFESFSGASVQNAVFEHGGATVFPTSIPTSFPLHNKNGTTVGSIIGIVIVGVCVFGCIVYLVFGEINKWGERTGGHMVEMTEQAGPDMAEEVRPAETQTIQVPFERFAPHRLVAGILPVNTGRGLHLVASTSPLHHYCRALCEQGGSWRDGPSPVAGFRLSFVQAVVHNEAYYASYTSKQERLRDQRLGGGDYFNFVTNQLTREQLLVLSALRDNYQETAPNASPKATRTFYCFHGPRLEHLESICRTGLVATRALDAGFFGSGCYSTLNIEYAVRYACGDFDPPERRRAPPADGRFPVIMLAASVSMAYPITPFADYGHVEGAPLGCSDYFGRPLKSGFDCHVVCVNHSSGYQAVNRDMCQYVEIVIEQESQMQPIAVLWFERT